MEEENTETTQSTIPTFPHAVHKSLHVLRRSRRLWRKDGSRELKVQHQTKEEVMSAKEDNNNNNGKICVVKEEEEEEEEEEIENKIHALKRIVPNGESLGVENLFDETAAYIMALQSQVKALRTIAAFFDNLEKENTKLGG
ncbi:putative myc-type, basic helix-loop-helix (bHLH) domain-containing protein [Lupinus albus]|uniref:Putative myc-type, basic helix-loop-helix (BHLH) domain-containing protein n=1 Tax=Lupinus albus TaxID=3870 RepID=A0A6A4PXB0_LUPAL|nr:putative myc-type, basic helix-loop-helix (bHLH) domain-containing protein [Lupinus albus]